MRRVDLPALPPLPGQEITYLMGVVRGIAEASALDNVPEIFDGYTVTNPPATPVRTLDAANATLNDVRAFLATIVADIKARGPYRVQ